MVEVYELGAYIDGLNNNSKSLLGFSTEIINNSNKLKTELEKLRRPHKKIILLFKAIKFRRIVGKLLEDTDKLIKDAKNLHNNVQQFIGLLEEWLSSIRGWVNSSINNPNNQNILQNFIESLRRINGEIQGARKILGNIETSLGNIDKDLNKINKNIEKIMEEIDKENKNISDNIVRIINEIRSLIKKAKKVVEEIGKFLDGFRIIMDMMIKTLEKGLPGLMAYLINYFIRYYF